MSDTHFFISCQIERGGFDTERSFEINTPDGGRLVGSASVRHFLNSNHKQLGDDIPPFGEVINGFVKCQVIRFLDATQALVELPSADVVHVSQEDLLSPCVK